MPSIVPRSNLVLPFLLSSSSTARDVVTKFKEVKAQVSRSPSYDFSHIADEAVS